MSNPILTSSRPRSLGLYPSQGQLCAPDPTSTSALRPKPCSGPGDLPCLHTLGAFTWVHLGESADGGAGTTLPRAGTFQGREQTLSAVAGKGRSEASGQQVRAGARRTGTESVRLALHPPPTPVLSRPSWVPRQPQPPSFKVPPSGSTV